MEHGKFPSLGGVAVAKRLTGWSVAFLHTLGGPPRRFAPPLQRRGIGGHRVFDPRLRKTSAKSGTILPYNRCT